MVDQPHLKVVPKPMRRLVEEAIRRAIIAGTFEPGMHLSDRMLCETFGASRSVVREAVRLLEAEGLVVVHPNRGPFVTTISAEEAREIYELRAALEGLAGEGFATRAGEEEHVALRKVHEELSAASSETSRETLLDIKHRFYEVLLRGCGNRYVSRALEPLLNRNSQLRATSLSAPDRLPQTIAELGRIVDAVGRHDAVAAGAACRAHVDRAAEAALRIIGARGGHRLESRRRA